LTPENDAIDIDPQIAADQGYTLQVGDIEALEQAHGRSYLDPS
jgi:hypothetical protein